jgi:hypothetical protein
MKIQAFAVILIITFILKSESQTNVVPIITTNVLRTMPWYREVGGNVYDPHYSALWKPINATVEIKEILTNMVVFQFCEVRNIMNNDDRLIGETRVYGKKFIIRHYSVQLVTAGPDGFESVGSEKTGSVLNFKDFVAMYVGMTNYEGEKMAVWDCGTPVQSDTVTFISTNLPSKHL